MISYGICLSLSDLLILDSVGSCLGPSMLLQMVLLHSFLWLSSIPLYVFTTSSFFLILFIFGCIGSLLRRVGFSLRWLLLLWITDSRHGASLVVAHGLSCSVACRIFPDQGSNPCPQHWQVDS